METDMEAARDSTPRAVPEISLPVQINDERISTPAVLIDLAKMDANIERMAAVARSMGVSLRPHAKTHKSADVARRQMQAGAVGVCCSTVGEAQALAEAGITDITLAYPVVGRGKLDRLVELARTIDLTLVADSLQVAQGYAAMADQCGRPVDTLIEIDTGMHRSGAAFDAVLPVAQFIAAQPMLSFKGILTHAGHAHDATTQVGIATVSRAEAAQMREVRDMLEEHGIPVAVVSAGSSITAPYFTADDGITEIRPGTYVYNDMRTLSNWACSIDEIAVSILSTVVSVSDERVVIDAGSKSLTMTKTSMHGFGYLPQFPDAQFERLSEEHGVIRLAQADKRLSVGDRIEILPIHVCVCIDLQREVYGVEHGSIVERMPIHGFRRSN